MSMNVVCIVLFVFKSVSLPFFNICNAWHFMILCCTKVNSVDIFWKRKLLSRKNPKMWRSFPKLQSKSALMRPRKIKAKSVLLWNEILSEAFSPIYDKTTLYTTNTGSKCAAIFSVETTTIVTLSSLGVFLRVRFKNKIFMFLCFFFVRDLRECMCWARDVCASHKYPPGTGMRVSKLQKKRGNSAQKKNWK